MWMITLNLNSIKTPIERQKLAECIKQQYPNIHCLYKTDFKHIDIDRLQEEKCIPC